MANPIGGPSYPGYTYSSINTRHLAYKTLDDITSLEVLKAGVSDKEIAIKATVLYSLLDNLSELNKLNLFLPLENQEHLEKANHSFALTIVPLEGRLDSINEDKIFQFLSMKDHTIHLRIMLDEMEDFKEGLVRIN